MTMSLISNNSATGSHRSFPNVILFRYFLILLRKLRGLGLSRNATEWFRSYLTDSLQLVRNGCISSTHALFHGVPQGSILVPALFDIYVVAICPSAVPNAASLNCYVDDSQLLMSFPVGVTSVVKGSVNRGSAGDFATWFSNRPLAR